MLECLQPLSRPGCCVKERLLSWYMWMEAGIWIHFATFTFQLPKGLQDEATVFLGPYELHCSLLLCEAGIQEKFR